MYEDYRKELKDFTYDKMYAAVVGDYAAIMEFERVYDVRVGMVGSATKGDDIDRMVTSLFDSGYRYIGCTQAQTEKMPVSFCASGCEVSLDSGNLNVFWINFHTQQSERRTILLGGLIASVRDTLPPARVLDELPPPSPQYEAALARWADFDGEW